MRIRLRVDNTNRKAVLSTHVDYDHFALYYLGDHKWETEAFAGYDGYIRNQFDSLVEAHAEYEEWVEESYRRRVEQVMK